jgi:putative SOS response-associated peptidase YedK
VPSRYSTINAKSETLLRLPTWRNGYKTRRALIPATEWFEYQKPNSIRYALGTGRPMMIAAVTAEATITEGPISCYSMIMQPAADHLAYNHDRSPLLIGPDLADDWLDPDRTGDQELLDVALAASEELLSEAVADLAPIR